MSIYATLWSLRFPKTGDDFYGCKWVTVIAQGVPAHIGTSTPGMGYEDGDPYGCFLPPPIGTDEHGWAEFHRAVVFVRERTPKGTVRDNQEYVETLLVMTGEEYARTTFADLHRRLCDALRGEKPRVVLQLFLPDGRNQVFHDDGSTADIPAPVAKRPKLRRRGTERRGRSGTRNGRGSRRR